MARLIVAVIAAAAAYSAAFTAPFVYEDHRWVGQTCFTCTATWNRMLTHISYWAQGDHALAIHLGNFALHVACALLVYRLARARDLSRDAATLAAIALLWAPAASQAVAYASGRSELLVALFVLIACVWPRPTVWVACAIALALTKDAAAPAALVLTFVAVWRLPLFWRSTVLGCATAVGLTAVAARWSIVTQYGAANTSENLGLLGQFASQFLVPLRLSFDVDPLATPLWAFALGACVFAVAGLLSWRGSLLAILVLALWAPRLIVHTGDTPQLHHAYTLYASLALVTGWVYHRYEASRQPLAERTLDHVYAR